MRGVFFMDKKFTTTEHNYIKPPCEGDKSDSSKDMAARRLVRNAFICFALIICLAALRTFGEKEPQKNEKTASGSELVLDEDLGKLKFVSDEVYTEPLEKSDVVSVFSDNDRTSGLSGEKNAEVKAILAGKVYEIGEDCVVMENNNSTVTKYSGIKPCVHAGESVNSAQVIGYLRENSLELETSCATGYIDSLNKEEVLTAGITCEEN